MQHYSIDRKKGEKYDVNKLEKLHIWLVVSENYIHLHTHMIFYDHIDSLYISIDE